MATSGLSTVNFSQTLGGGSDSIMDCLCDLCSWEGKQVDAHGYCSDCKEYLCKDCYRVHLKPTPMRHHVLLDKHQMPKDQQQNQGKDTCTEACPEHKSKTVEYHCTTHAKFGCSVCMTISHRNCEGVQYIPEVATSMLVSQEYKEMQQALRALTQTAKQDKKKSQDQGKVTETYHNNALQAMKQFRKDINEACDKLEHKLAQEADKFKTEDMRKIDLIEKQCNNILKDIQTLESKFISLQNNHQYCQMFIAIKRACDEIKRIEISLNKTDSDINIRNYKLKLSGEAQKFLQGPEKMAAFECLKDAPVPQYDTNHYANLSNVQRMTAVTPRQMESSVVCRNQTASSLTGNGSERSKESISSSQQERNPYALARRPRRRRSGINREHSAYSLKSTGRVESSEPISSYKSTGSVKSKESISSPQQERSPRALTSPPSTLHQLISDLHRENSTWSLKSTGSVKSTESNWSLKSTGSVKSRESISSHKSTGSAKSGKSTSSFTRKFTSFLKNRSGKSSKD